MNNSLRDLTHTTLLLLFIGLLIGGSFWILKPFLLALIWAIMIVVATWPLLRRAVMARRPSVARRSGHDRRAMMILIADHLRRVTVVDHSLEIVAGSKSLLSLRRRHLGGWNVCR
jgi:NADH:ubiquinone oxidoreductase subunit 6 (subunit J)